MIRQLPADVINRIAAGEVIERPAAVVRELVENALDAGAARIAVAIEEGGVARTLVRDDGAGMAAAELALALTRHCTSKLPDGDLVRIATLGFRGEALPSIGAAARLTLTSRPVGGDAHRVTLAGGVLGPTVPCAAPAGTQALVEDLFFATPARRKFLKSSRTEADHAETALRRLAMAAPAVGFQLSIDGRPALDLPSADRAVRVAALLGEPALLPVAGERGALRLAGFAAPPSVSRATAAGLALVVNGRPVADPLLRLAVRVAYRGLIEAGRHPVAALWLDLPPEDVDVNVHPAKAEVRFRDADSVRALVIGAVGRALGVGAGAVAPRVGWGPALRLGALGHNPPAPAGFAEAALPLGASPSARGGANGAATVPSPAHPLGAAVAQVLDTYIVAVTADAAIVLVDQHAAHERLTQEALAAEHLDGGVRPQPLLVPAVVELPDAAVRRLLATAVTLAALGLEIEPFGAGAVLVRALPALLGAADPAPLARDIADELAEGESSTLAARLDAVIARMACHGSIRAGRRLGLPEMDALLRRMEAVPRAATCSHGRPTFLKLSQAEIERLFGRR